MAYVFLDPADYIVGKPISFEEYAQLVENANQAYGAGTNHGEILATRAGTATNGATVSGSTPGPYTWVVPAGVTKIIIEICGGGGGGGAGSTAATGGASSVVGSSSGSIVSAAGGVGSVSGAVGTGGVGAGTFGASGGDGVIKSGTGSVCGAGGGAGRQRFATPPHAYFLFDSTGVLDDAVPCGGPGGFGGAGGTGYSAAGGILTNPTGFGNGGGGQAGGGGAAGAEGMFTVVPGETLTFTVGAGGAGDGSSGTGPGSPGMIRIRF